MFQNWGFLLGEIWVLLLLAALLGLLAGWLIWSRRDVNIAGGDAEAKDQRIAALSQNLKARDVQIRPLEADLADCRSS